MNVWWCAVHDSPMETMSFCTRRLMFHGDSHQATSCSRRGALVLVRDAEGNWPAWAISAISQAPYVVGKERIPTVLDALAEAAKDNPHA